MLRDDFYFLSEMTLKRFKLFQDFEPSTSFPGSRIQQAYFIWAQSSLGVRKQLAEANGFPMTDQPILPGEAYLVFSGNNGRPTGSAIVKNSRWYED